MLTVFWITRLGAWRPKPDLALRSPVNRIVEGSISSSLSIRSSICRLKPIPRPGDNLDYPTDERSGFVILLSPSLSRLTMPRFVSYSLCIATDFMSTKLMAESCVAMPLPAISGGTKPLLCFFM